MNKSLLSILLLFLALSSCETEGFMNGKTLDFGKFKIEVPSSWRKDNSPGPGFDSFVGGITNGKESLSFDYGWYSYNFRKETATTHNRTTTTIDGRPAFVVQPKARGKGIIGLYVAVDSLTKFNLYGTNLKDEETVLQIFKSVRFE